MKPPTTISHPEISGLLEIQYDFHSDHRGMNVEGFNPKLLPEIGPFALDSYSYSIRGTVRGLHGDKLNAKLIQLLYGAMFFVVVDMREESPTYLNAKTFTTDRLKPTQYLVPEGCVNGHQILSDSGLFSYKLSSHYAKPEDQIHVKYNDPRFNIQWPISEPILSDRDK